MLKHTVAAGGLRRGRLSAWSSLSTRLLLLVLAVALPLTALSAVTLWQAHQIDRQGAEQALVDQARAVAVAVDGGVREVQAGLETLAVSSALLNGDLSAFDAELRNAATRLPGVLGIGLNAPDGRQLLNTLWPEGSAPKDARSPEPVARVFRTARPFISDMTFSPALRDYVVGVLVPVFLPGNATGRPDYVLGAGLAAARLNELLDKLALPGPNWVASVHDRSGVIVARSRNGTEFIGHKGRPEIIAATSKSNSGIVRLKRIADAGPMLAAFAHAPESGYVVLVFEPQSDVNSTLHLEIGRTLAIAFVLGLAGLIAAWLVARGIIRALRLVAAGAGPVTGIREVDRLARDLARASADLRTSEARARAVFEESAIGMAVLLPNGRFAAVNPRLCAMLGYTERELQHRTYRDITHPEDLAANVSLVDRALAGERATLHFEKRYLRKDDSQVWVSVSAVLIRNELGAPSHFISVIEDVTQRKQTEAALLALTQDLELRVRDEIAARQEAQRRAAHAERIQALGQLAGGVAHDINNVLQTVQGAAALIEARPGADGAVRRFARMIVDAAERGASITRRLLAFARRSDLSIEPIDVGAILADLRPILTVTLGPAIGLRTEVPSGLPPALADRGQLETVLLNLVTNARDAIGETGEVVISAAVSEAGPREASALGLRAGPYVQIAVTDNGSGMNEATLRRVTEPFFTTKPVGKGTGLGLAMAKGFAEQSGGALEVESTEGVGTTVRIWLPPGGGAQARAGAEPASEAQGRKARVLVVDDDLPVLETIASQLETFGFPVVTAREGTEALALLDAGAAVEAMVTDLSMPGINGADLIREARARRPGLPVILVTGHAADPSGIAPETEARGGVRVLGKPVPMRQLIQELTALLEEAAGEGMRARLGRTGT